MAALLASCAACAGASTALASPSPSARDCSGATFPFPPPSLALSEVDTTSGRVHIGDLVEVTLHGDAVHRWAPVNLSGDALLRRPDPAAAATVGTQLGEFCAAHAGHAVLSSSDGSRSWSVAVDVVP